MRLFLSKKRFREAALKYAFDNQKPQTDGFEKMRLVFIDSHHKRYYQYNDNLEMPMIRKGKLEMYYNWMASGMTGQEVLMFADAIEKAGDDCINNLKADGKIKGLGRIQAIAEEMRRRKDMIIHEDICFRIIGLQYIREDQNPKIWDQELEDEKIKQFRKDSEGGLEAFFMGSPLKKLLPFSDMSEAELTNYLNEFRATMEYQTKLLNTSSLGVESESIQTISTTE